MVSRKTHLKFSECFNVCQFFCILFKDVSIFIGKFVSINMFLSLRNKFPKLRHYLTWWSNYWMCKIVSFFDAKLLWYQKIVIVALLTIYYEHVCEYLQKKIVGIYKIVEIILIVQGSPVRRVAAGGVNRFRWTNHMKAKCFDVIIVYTNIYSVKTRRWIWTKIVEVTHE